MGVHHHKINATTDGLVLELDASNKICYKGARSAVLTSANSDYYNNSDVVFDRGDEDFSICGWFAVDDLASDVNVFAKWAEATNKRNFRLYSPNGVDGFRFEVTSDGTAGTLGFVTSALVVQQGKFHFVVAKHDSVSNQIQISIDGSSFSGLGATGGIPNLATQLIVGGIEDSKGSDCKIDTLMSYSKALTDAQKDYLYNGGKGRTHSELSADALTSLDAFWTANDAGIDKNLIDLENSYVLAKQTSTIDFANGAVLYEDPANLILNSVDRVGAVHYNGSTIVNNSFLFDGVDDFISADKFLTAIQSETVGSVEFWVKFVDLVGDSSQTIFSVGDADGSNLFWIVISGNGQCTVQTRVAGVATMTIRTDNIVFSDDVWHHVVVTQDGVLVKIYVDTTLPAQSIITGVGTKWIAEVPTPDNVGIGRINFNNNNGDLYLHGELINLKYYNKALSTNEILRNNQSQKDKNE